jgi:3-oxoacyl-[acyl-carrier protein] reductase
MRRIDVLINNAGATADRMSHKMELSEWNEVINANLTASFLWTKAALKPMMKQRSGKIVMISSRLGIKGAIGAANYAASKAALIGFAKSVAKEMGRYDILVNAVCPGFMKSRMTEILPQVCWDSAAKESALGKHGDADEVAKFITYLVSDQTKNVTGQVFSWDSRV